jgi:phenylacetate-CoA ligase
MDKMHIYNAMPLVIQNAGCRHEGKRLAELRYGGDFKSKLDDYNSRITCSRDELLAVRDEKLQRMVKFCYEQVPFYQELFNEGGIDPLSIKTADDLLVLPVLDKQTVRENIEKLKPKNLEHIPHVTEHTSGSTGSSLIFPQSVENIRDLWAAFWRFWNRIGIEFGTMYADFGSRTIVPPTQKKPPFWRECQPLFQIKFSAFHGNDENYMAYYNAINDYGLTWIHGYPTCIMPFAAFVAKNNLSFKLPIKAVTVSAENLYDYQRATIKEAFGVETHSLYSLTEATACIGEDAEHDFIVDEDYSVVEFVNAGDFSKIVGTNLTNFAFPLLRYDTGDLVVTTDKIKNGRRVIERIDGRSGELLTLPDGGKVGALSALFTESSSIKEAQIHQASDYSVEIKFVPYTDEFTKDIAIAEQRFKDRTKGMLPVEFKRVESIERTKRGKLRYVISDIK